MYCIVLYCIVFIYLSVCVRVPNSPPPPPSPVRIGTAAAGAAVGMCAFVPPSLPLSPLSLSSVSLSPSSLSLSLCLSLCLCHCPLTHPSHTALTLPPHRDCPHTLLSHPYRPPTAPSLLPEASTHTASSPITPPPHSCPRRAREPHEPYLTSDQHRRQLPRRHATIVTRLPRHSHHPHRHHNWQPDRFHGNGFVNEGLFESEVYYWGSQLEEPWGVQLQGCKA